MLPILWLYTMFKFTLCQLWQFLVQLKAWEYETHISPEYIFIELSVAEC